MFSVYCPVSSMLYVDAIYVFLPVFFWVFSVGYYWRLFLFYSSPSCDHYCNPFVTMWSSLLFSVEHKGCFEKFGFFVVVVVFFLTKETGFQHFIYFHARVWTPLIWLNTEVRLKFIDFFLFDLFETFNISSRKKKKKHLMGKESLTHSKTFFAFLHSHLTMQKCFLSVI